MLETAEQFVDLCFSFILAYACYVFISFVKFRLFDEIWGFEKEKSHFGCFGDAFVYEIEL
jgi:hypothetical protein